YGAAEKVGRERCPHQSSVATIGSTEDCHLFRVRDALIYCPLHGVYQVVVHVSSPLPITSVDKILAIACRTSKIHLQAGVSTVGKPLRIRTISPRIARPGTTMHIEHHWQVGLLLALRQGQVAVNSQPVPAGEGDRFH